MIRLRGAFAIDTDTAKITQEYEVIRFKRFEIKFGELQSLFMLLLLVLARLGFLIRRSVSWFDFLLVTSVWWIGPKRLRFPRRQRHQRRWQQRHLKSRWFRPLGRRRHRRQHGWQYGQHGRFSWQVWCSLIHRSFEYERNSLKFSIVILMLMLMWVFDTANTAYSVTRDILVFVLIDVNSIALFFIYWW